MLANTYSLTQEEIDATIEDINKDYEGFLGYEGFVKFMEKLDPKLMEPDIIKNNSPQKDGNKENEPNATEEVKEKVKPPTIEKITTQNAIVPNSNLTL